MAGRIAGITRHSSDTRNLRPRDRDDIRIANSGQDMQNRAFQMSTNATNQNLRYWPDANKGLQRLNDAENRNLRMMPSSTGSLPWMSNGRYGMQRGGY